MDSELWTSRLAAAKQQYSLQQQHSHLDRLSIDDFEVEEDVRVDFPCPYCFDDYDIASLCSHLEDEHPFEAKVTVCPICSVKVTRDMLNHIMIQHGHLFKLQRRRRLRRVALSNNSALSLLGRDLREAHLQVLLGGGGLRSSSNNSSHIASDSFLSSLVLNLSAPEVEDISKSAICGVEDADAKNITPMQTWKPSLCSSLSSEEREQKTRQAGFVQDLLLSTLFGD
ncbi:protein DEHYDRATION-INDUCED 19 homolog 4 [Amborella trichopoda]|uniref:protein DEHYDRATION-INDUCED 19 homolog 4 n=1 Tax=Amborella trichopoda TaxID=13333 RepID=UPI0005D416C0|nr:protein DEHYDRATION-INDUCED 19 homolog 4 [Amborella trichopoda]|eukprot:XP_011623611.1 protein DEHYDRATION-INDUCED 19 homolog 4 [Amborella trichopoda]